MGAIVKRSNARYRKLPIDVTVLLKNRAQENVSQCEISWDTLKESCIFAEFLKRVLSRFLSRAPRKYIMMQCLVKGF